MIPIFEQGHGQGIGHSFNGFLRRFTDICEEHLENGRAKAFAFILYDFNDSYIKNDILKNLGGFAKLDRLSGKELSVFYFNSNNRKLLKAFNEIFIGAFEISEEHQLPFVLYFKIKDSEVVDVEIVELEQTELVFAFQELYDSIDFYIKSINSESVNVSIPKDYKHIRFLKSVKKIVLDKFVQFLIEKAIEYAKHNIY